MSITAATPPPSGQFGPEVYAAWHRSSLGEITDKLEQRLILSLLEPLQGRSVLDVGCGDGTLARVYAHCGADRVHGCDPDFRMIAHARTRHMGDHATIDLVVARSQALPYADRSFDVVTCITVLTFIQDVDVVVREMTRVLRPGGRLVIGDLGKWSYWAVHRRIRGWLGATLWRDARFHSASELTALIRDAGLTIGEVRGAIFFPPWTGLARLMASFDLSLGRATTLGAAFVAIQATKP
jgi:ubiquinone/menaquinone biosynthesis C-methylase UbiE